MLMTITPEEAKQARTSTFFNADHWGYVDSYGNRYLGPVAIIAQLRGTKFKETTLYSDVNDDDERYKSLVPVDCSDTPHEVLDEIADWLGFDGYDDYLENLPTLKDDIFNRATYGGLYKMFSRKEGSTSI